MGAEEYIYSTEAPLPTDEEGHPVLFIFREDLDELAGEEQDEPRSYGIVWE